MTKLLDMIKAPYVFAFPGVPENEPMIESDIEKALVAQIEKFLLELGRSAIITDALRQMWQAEIDKYANV